MTSYESEFHSDEIAAGIFRNLIEADQLQQQDVEWISNVLSSNNAESKSSVCELLSKYFKYSRKDSHPERSIGKSMLHVEFKSRKIIISKLLDIIISTSVFNFAIWATMPSFVQVYYLHLCSDCIKELMKVGDNKSSLKAFLVNLLVAISTLFERYIPLSMQTSVYWPLVTKLLQISIQINSADVDLLPESYFSRISNCLNDIVSLIVSPTSCSLIYRQISGTTREVANFQEIDPSLCLSFQMNCQFVTNEYSVLHWLDLIHFVVTFVNLLLKRINASPLSMNEEAVHDATGLPSCVASAMLQMARLISAIPSALFVKLLTIDDKCLLLSVQAFVELQLRLEAYFKECSPLEKGSSYFCCQEACSQLYKSMFQHEYDIECLFCRFVEIALCWDVTVCVDMLTSNETNVLSYLLRVTKHATVQCNLWNRLQDCCHQDPAEFDAILETIPSGHSNMPLSGEGRRIMDEKCAVIVALHAGEDRKIARRLDVAKEEWKHGGSHAVTSSHRQSGQTAITESTIIQMHHFLDELSTNLKSKDQHGLLPFSPELICGRLDSMCRSWERQFAATTNTAQRKKRKKS